jgi:hypothetical protein
MLYIAGVGDIEHTLEKIKKNSNLMYNGWIDRGAKNFYQSKPSLSIP